MNLVGTTDSRSDADRGMMHACSRKQDQNCAGVSVIEMAINAL